MLAVGRIGYDSDYADRFGHTVAGGDLDVLRDHHDELAFAEGEGGALSPFFGTFAGALPIETFADIEEYFAVLARTFEEGRLGVLAEAYPEVVSSDRFFKRGIVGGSLQEDRQALSAGIKKLAEVYLRSFEAYVNQVWPVAQEAIQPRLQALNTQYQQKDYIATWERFLKMEWDGPRYEMVVCYANKNGPDYNSLGYNANLIYYDKPFDRTWQFVSHEIGTHLLIDVYMDLAESDRYDQRELYAAYECMAMFFNRMVLGLPKLAYDIPQFESERRLGVYASIYRGEMGPRELISTALGE